MCSSDLNIHWSKTGRIQLNEEVTVTLTLDMDAEAAEQADIHVSMKKSP